MKSYDGRSRSTAARLLPSAASPEVAQHLAMRLHATNLLLQPVNLCR